MTRTRPLTETSLIEPSITPCLECGILVGAPTSNYIVRLSYLRECGTALAEFVGKPERQGEPVVAIDAIIVDPFLESRMRLKQVANSVCKNVRLASSLAEGIERLGGDLDFGIVCLSSRFDRSHATEFLGKAKKSKGGLDSAYVLVIGHDSANDESTLAHSMLTGFDASLVEPCSVKDFEQTAELATELKTKRRREREEIAVRLLVESALRHLDEVSLAKRMKRPCILATTKLQEITNAVKVLPEEMHQFYFSALAAAAEAATPVSLYTGASERLRRHMIVRRG